MSGGGGQLVEGVRNENGRWGELGCLGREDYLMVALVGNVRKKTKRLSYLNGHII